MPENRTKQADAQAALRSDKGRFAKGASGNPGGRPALMAEVRELASQHVPAAIKGLVAIAKDTDAPPAARVAAWSQILDRAVGKPSQAVEHNGADGAPLSIQIIRKVST